MLGLILLAALAPFLTRAGVLANPTQQMAEGLDSDGLPLPPSSRFPLGSDNLGRDVLARILHGARNSLWVGIASMLTATLIGVTTGLIAGFFGGKTDWILMRFTEINLALPAILLAIALAGLMDGRIVHLHPSFLPWHAMDLKMERGLLSVLMIVGLVCWPGMVRVIRAQVMVLREREFVTASQALGASSFHILLRHILPNILPLVFVLAVMTTANTILLESGLGYLGVGVPPPTPSWGSMIADGQPYFVAAPLIVIAPGLALALTVLGFNLLGQGLQEVLE